jgi:hypothetical protein
MPESHQVLTRHQPGQYGKGRKDEPIQNVPMRPKQPSSILVDTGFMFLLTLNAELKEGVQYLPRHRVA